MGQNMIPLWPTWQPLTGDNFPAVLSVWTPRPPHGCHTVPVMQRVTYVAGSPFVSHHAACVCSQGPRESSQSCHSLCNSWCNLHASRPSAPAGTHISTTCPQYQFLIICFPTCTPEGCLLFTQQLQICSGLTELLNFSVIWWLNHTFSSRVWTPSMFVLLGILSLSPVVPYRLAYTLHSLPYYS